MKYKPLLRLLLLVPILGCAAYGYAAEGESACGSLANHYGPFDYRSAPQHVKELVERPHFPPKVENLIAGQNTITPGGDIAYTLNVFPNHHRALMAIIKLAKKEKTNRPRELGYSVECRFERAERFVPDDGMVKLLHGVYLLQTKNHQEAIGKLEEALALSGENANVFYNLGLAYFELKDYDKALSSAHGAYRLGHPLPGLRNKLNSVGKWREPTPESNEPSQK